jgi:hypothetical protein
VSRGEIASVLKAEPDPASGEISEWTEQEPLPVDTGYLGATAICNDRIYIAGGRTGACAMTPVVYFADLEADGGITAWQDAGADLQHERNVAGIACTASHLYVASGGDCVGGIATIELAELQQDGTLGEFQYATASLPVAQSGAAVVIRDDDLYILPSYALDGSNEPYDSILHGSIGGDGDIGDLTEIAPQSPPRQDTAHAARCDRVFALAGSDTVTAESYTLGPGAAAGGLVAGTDLPAGRMEGGAAIVGGYLYFFGGNSATQNTYHADVWYAPVSFR